MSRHADDHGAAEKPPPTIVKLFVDWVPRPIRWRAVAIDGRPPNLDAFHITVRDLAPTRPGPIEEGERP